MIWLQVEDSYFYKTDNNYSLLREKIAFGNKELSDLIEEKIKFSNFEFVLIFDKDSLKEILYSCDYENTVIISPFEPKTLGYDTSFFGVYKVSNTEGILTSSEKFVGIQKQHKLNQALGLFVTESKFNFNNSNQDKRLVDVARYLTLKYMTGELPKAVFLSGVMGTGKSFFAQCLAGETKRLLISFNLANIMNEPNPLKAFDNVIEYLVENNNEKYLLWIDEIDKIFNGSPESEHIKNKFLTFLNDLGLTIFIDTFVVMTTNKVEDILTNFPEMIRAGRVEPIAKIFLDMLSCDEAKKTAQLYLDLRNSIKSKNAVIINTMIWLNSGSAMFIDSFKNLSYFNKIIPKLDLINSITFDNLKYKLTKEEKFNLFSQKLTKIFTEDELNDIYDSLHLNVSADKIIEYIDRNYRSIHPNTKITAFYYVNAEIKELVSQIYFRHLESCFKNDDDTVLENDLKEIIKNNIAIVDASISNYKKMLGNLGSFSIVIGQNANNQTGYN